VDGAFFAKQPQQPNGDLPMQYSKAMIKLVYQIRKHVPDNLKPAIKLANPALFHVLQSHHARGSNVARGLINELFTLAGSNWSAQLDPVNKCLEQPPVKVYRGQVLSIEPPAPNTQNRVRTRDDLMYRGRKI
jgi:hypothetical protein